MKLIPNHPIALKLGREFYTRPDTLLIAKELIGKLLVIKVNDERLSGFIVETEAYLGAEDRACHAFGGRHTERTSVMFAVGGTAYVYFCYGVHNMFNVVTNVAGSPHAILVRGIEPCEGIDQMLHLRGHRDMSPKLTAGPGALAKAMGITRALTGEDLTEDQIWIEDHKISIAEENLQTSPRVGVDYAGEDALLPYRVRLKNNRWTSPAK